MTLSNDNAGGNVLNKVTNTDDTNTASHAFVDVRAGGSSGGDAYVRYAVEGVLDYSWGIDNTDSDAMVLTNAATLNGTNFWKMTTAGERTLPLQPAFLGTSTATDSNLTGDATNVILGDTDVATTLTERFDQGGDFVPGSASGAVFTAPVTGKYNLSGGVLWANLTAAHDLGNAQIVTSNRSIINIILNPGVGRSSASLPDVFGVVTTALEDMDAADTATIQFKVEGSTKTVGMYGLSQNNYFCGHLAC